MVEGSDSSSYAWMVAVAEEFCANIWRRVEEEDVVAIEDEGGMVDEVVEEDEELDTELLEGVIGVEEITELFPVVEKMTRFAVSPAGTVTTQYCAPPAPTVPLEHELTPMVAGLHSQGIPLQFPLGQSILIAKPGSVVW